MYTLQSKYIYTVCLVSLTPVVNCQPAVYLPPASKLLMVNVLLASITPAMRMFKIEMTIMELSGDREKMHHEKNELYNLLTLSL